MKSIGWIVANSGVRSFSSVVTAINGFMFATLHKILPWLFMKRK